MDEWIRNVGIVIATLGGGFGLLKLAQDRGRERQKNEGLEKKVEEQDKEIEELKAAQDKKIEELKGALSRANDKVAEVLARELSVFMRRDIYLAEQQAVASADDQTQAAIVELRRQVNDNVASLARAALEFAQESVRRRSELERENETLRRTVDDLRRK